MLQKLGIEILTSLALEENATERIGGTGGILFFKEATPQNQIHVRIAAGEALALLALDSKSNCHRILKLKVLDRLVETLEVPLLRVNYARILTNLCSYSSVELIASTSYEDFQLQPNRFIVQDLLPSLNTYQKGTNYRKNTNIHRLRKVIWRFAIELAIWMMTDKVTNVHIFKEMGMEKELEVVLETTAELKIFNIFSGTVGLSKHSTTIHSLVETALKLLEDE
ncbi:hypothetical protein EZV62_008034 [Acer yangbiense]|uniref:Armadillo repeat-containing domain-containing protein n=1 Tax=Acer yangbiense TaxID=1000413 RepID=A0A5C7ID01_9ROSI|nr:hypothetical protein EZV62_008034 [Acer yangbiense]